MFRLLLSFSMLLSAFMLNAATYDDDVLSIFSKVLPRLVLMSNTKDEIKNEIEICILHDDIDEKKAALLIKKTNDIYPNGIKNYHITLKKTNYSNIIQCEDSKLMFLFNSDEKNIHHVLDFSRKHAILTTSYDSQLLKDGADISMFLGRKIVPYINLGSIQGKEIVLHNTLLRISKIYKREDQ